jgi:protein AroM
MVSKKIGIVCIGQTPRPDVVSFVERALGKNYETVIAGALDGFTFEDIPEFRDEEYLLMTTMYDKMGQRKSVRVTREFLVPLLQRRINEISKNYPDAIIIWCAGRFPEFKSKIMVIRPSEILKGVVEAIIKRGRLGVIYPSKEQLIWALPEWSHEGVEIYSDSLGILYSREEELKMLAERLARKELDLILLNCASFGNDMKQLIVQRTGKPVIQANTLTLQVVKELIN